MSNLQSSSKDIVTWEDNYATGIELLDFQHKELIGLTNQLYQACMSGDDVLQVAFKESMRRMVDYVRFHFSAEQELLVRIKFPEYAEHKKQHDMLIKDILEAAKDYNEGHRFVPINFVRTLKDWVFGHIALTDKIYAAFFAEQKKKGLLSDSDVK